MTGYSPEINITDCRLGYARALFKPEKGVGDKEKYGATLLIPKARDIGFLREAAAQAARDEWKDKAEAMVRNGVLKNPILDGDGPQGVNKKTAERRPEYVNHWFIRTTATLEVPPKLFGRTWPLAPAVEGTDLYSGCYVEAVVSAYTWHNPQNGSGISFGLRFMRMVRDGERIGGGGGSAPEDHFGKIEDAGAAPDAAKSGQGAAGLFA